MAEKPTRVPPPLPPAAAEEKAAEGELKRFHDFCRRGQTELVDEALGENKALAVAVGALGNTAAHWAAGSGHEAVLESVLAAGAGVNVTNDVGETPLHMAAWRGHAVCAQRLLQAGADKALKNNEGKTATDLVRHDEMREVLPEFDAAALTSLIQLASDDESSDEE